MLTSVTFDDQRVQALRQSADGARPWRKSGELSARRRDTDSSASTAEIALASKFVDRHADRYRWTPGLDWMRNEGTRFVPDDTLERFDSAKRICAEAASSEDLQDGTRRAIASAKTVAALVTLARSDPRIVTPVDAWDRDPLLLNTPGGVVDLEAGKLIQTTDLFTQITSVAPDWGMRTPVWSKFISEIFGGDLTLVEFVQRHGGYCLTGDRRDQVVVFWYGSGANGKSVLEEVLRTIVGTYALNLPAEVLMRQQNQQHPTELAQLRGRRVAISSELEDGAYWAESRLKSLTGDATLTARFMRQDFFEFRQTQKHIVLGNFKPRLRGDDPAIGRRMLLVPFLEKFTGPRCDPLLPAKLRAEYPGILAWFIDGARKWAQDGLMVPQAIRDASAEYLAAHDDIGLWIEERCQLGTHLRSPAKDLYKSFSEWKDAAGERAQSMTAWGARMSQRFTPFRSASFRGYAGIALADGGYHHA